MEFKPKPLDTMATITTILTTALLIILSIFFLIKGIPYGWIFVLLMISIVVFSYLLSPKNYYLESGKFVIEKVIGRRIVISINEIEGVEKIEDFCKLKPVRSMGNGGLFGYYGIFTAQNYGNINTQLTSKKNILIIKTKKGIYAISPARPEALIEYLHATSGIKEAMLTEPERLEKRKGASFLILLIPDTIFTLTIIMVILLYQHLPARIAIHFNFAGNPDGWGSKNSYLFSGIMPQVLMVIIAIIVFFTTRNRYQTNRMVYLLVVIISLVQLLLSYVSFDIYWFNTRNTHFIPMPYLFAGFIILMFILFTIYYKLLHTKTK